MSRNRITVLRDNQGFTATVRDTGTAGAWELEWVGTPDAGRAYRMLHNAETAVLRNGGEVLIVNCPEEQPAVREYLDEWPQELVGRAGDTYRLQLIHPAEDGLIHEDDDFRTPLDRITCPTCVERIARQRTEKREESFGSKNGPKEIARHTRLIAEAYTRLAQIEENLDVQGLKSGQAEDTG